MNMMPMMYQQQTRSLNLRLARNDGHNLTSSTLMKIFLSKPNNFLHFFFEMMSAYECVLSFPHSDQANLWSLHQRNEGSSPIRAWLPRRKLLILQVHRS